MVFTVKTVTATKSMPMATRNKLRHNKHRRRSVRHGPRADHAKRVDPVPRTSTRAARQSMQLTLSTTPPKQLRLQWPKNQQAPRMTRTPRVPTPTMKTIRRTTVPDRRTTKRRRCHRSRTMMKNGKNSKRS